jgi:3-oxoacyl-[acyl-carrier protein] reductase
MNVNIKGMFLVTRAVSRYMVKARYGRIINISSVVAQGGHEGQSAYCASKSAVEGFTKSLARELAKRNITVNAVAPGFIETELTAKLDDKARFAIFQQIPMQRFGTPDEVASVVVWLASQSASYITGAVIPVNGGIYM